MNKHRILVSRFGVFKKLFILSKHGTKANIRSTKMANNRHAYNMDVLQSYWTSVYSRLVRKHTQTNNVKDLPRSGRSWVTSVRDGRALQRLVRRMPFATSPVLKQHCLLNRHLSTKTVKKPSEISGRVNKRSLLVNRYRRSRLAWCLARRSWNLRTWRKIHWSDESRFLLHLTVGRKTQKYSLYPNENPPNCPLWWRLSNGLGVYL